MEFGILGPVEVRIEGRAQPLRGAKQRGLLSVLLLDANRVVPVARLVEALWGEAPPESATKAIQVYVSHLRKALGPNVVETRPGGYLVRVELGALDLDRFDALVTEGRQALATGDAAAAAQMLRDALALWRGPALAELGSVPLGVAEAGRLDEQRVAALEDRIDADLALGRHHELIAELEVLVGRHPLRERPRRQLMLALYRCGRQPESLAAYQETRRLLLDELGIDPSPSLQELERAILVQDPALDVPMPPEVREVPEPPPPETALRVEERKLVTVLFAELSDSPELTERLDPERLRVVLGEYFGAMGAVIEARGGRIEQLVAGAVVAVFGIPSMHEDDAERAVGAALAMRARLEELNGKMADRFSVQLAVRIGVSTGEVIAAPADGELAIIGDVFNTAARMRQWASPGEVMIDERTWLAAHHAFLLDPVPGEESHSPRAWRVLDASGGPRRRRLSGRLVGRGRELQLLTTLYETVAAENRARLVTIVGEAGIGKSRLTEEFLESLDGSASVAVGRCLSYGEGITYWPLREILWDAAQIRLDDTSSVAAEKLLAFTSDSLAPAGVANDEIDRTAFALAATAGIALSHGELDTLSPESIGDEIALAWPRLLTVMARERPMVVVIEDLHWAEAPLLEMLERLVSRSVGRILIVATARPEFAEAERGWSSRATLAQISLEPLVDADAEDLLAELLPAAAPDLRTKVLATAEGNPFFAEEIVAHLMEEGVPADDVSFAIPDSIRAVLAARIDALPAAEKQTLQDASVVGRVFWPTTLESMRAEAPTREILRALEDRGLVSTRPGSSLAGQHDVLFRHALTREVAYHSIPRARRARAHAEVGDWIERTVADRRNEVVELLAHHYESAARPEEAELAWPDEPEHRDELRRKAVDALIDAARTTTTRFAIDQALSFGNQALVLAASDAERLRALEARAEAAHAAVRADEAWADYLRALELAERIGDDAATARIAARTSFLWSRYAGALGDLSWREVALDIVERGLRAAGGEHRPTFEVGALLAARAAAHFWGLGAFSLDEAERSSLRALEIAEELDSTELLSYVVDDLTMLRSRQGARAAGESADLVLAARKRIPDPRVAHEMLVTVTERLVAARRFEEAEAISAEAARTTTGLATHPRIHAAAARAEALLSRGRLPEIADATAAVPGLVEEEGRRTCFLGLLSLAAHALCAYECGRRSDAARALALLDATEHTVPDPLGFRFWAAETARPARPLDAVPHLLREMEEPTCPAAEVRRLRLVLPIAALSGRDTGGLAQAARGLATTTCTPALAELANWADAVELARSGDSRGAAAVALAAASALESLDEQYLAARILADLLRLLDEPARADLAVDAAARLEVMGAFASAAAVREARNRPRARAARST